MVDRMDDEYWQHADALEEAVEDLDQLHRILTDARRDAAIAGYHQGRIDAACRLIAIPVQAKQPVVATHLEGVPA